MGLPCQERRWMSSQASTSGSLWSCSPRSQMASTHKEARAPYLDRRYHSTMDRQKRKCAVAASLDADPLYSEVEYSHEANEEYWDVRPVKVMNRTVQIGRSFSGWLLSSKIFGEGGLRRISGYQAERLREILTDLGPAFVKIGQALSSRPDIVPPGFLKELEKLQDDIPPFSDKEAMRIIEEDLGQPVAAIFSEISQRSVAAASLGQVYRARLRSTGQWVAVKVQRPKVRESIALDVYIMRYFAGQLGRLRKLNSDLSSLLDEWAGSLFRELDYKKEAQNGTLFKELYSHLEGIYVPDMVHELTTARVLTMEWLDGVRLRSAGQTPSDGQSLRPEDMKLIEFGVQCSLEQMLEEGFYHADPHPGNLLRLKNGKLGYMDFGMMASIGPTIRRSLISATLHMVNREFGSLAKDFESLGLLPPGSEKDKVEPALAGVFEKALSGGVSNMSFGSLSGDLGKTMYEFKFRIPAYYILLVRSLSVLEGIALSSDPNYKVLGAAYPWIARRLLSAPGPELQETLRALLYKDEKFQFSRLESLLRQALKSPARLSRKGEPVSNGASLGDKPLQLLLGKDGAFLRGVVLDELAKGIDAALRLSTDNLIGQAKRRIAVFLRGSERSRQIVQQNPQNASLLEALRRLPALADRSDKLQVEGIQGLVNVLQSVRADSSTSQSSGTAQSPRDVNQTVVMLQWILQEIGSLSPDARLEALRIPLSLGGRLSSRLLARAIKTFAGRDEKTPVKPLTAKSQGKPSPKVIPVEPQRAMPQTVQSSKSGSLSPAPRSKNIDAPQTIFAASPDHQLGVKSELDQQARLPSIPKHVSNPTEPNPPMHVQHSNQSQSSTGRQGSNAVAPLVILNPVTDAHAEDTQSFASKNGKGHTGFGQPTSVLQDAGSEQPSTSPKNRHQRLPEITSNSSRSENEKELTAADARSYDWRVKRLYQRQQEEKRARQKATV